MEPTVKTRPRRTQRERREESTRRLLQATIELIGEKGFERTTAAEIGERAGYSRMMVRSRYGSKEALLESLMRTEYEPRLLPPTGDEDSGLERALGQIGFQLGEAVEGPELLRAFFVLCFEAVGPTESLRPWLTDWLDRYQGEVASALRAGQRDGSVRPEIDPGLEAQRVIEQGLGMAFRWTLDPTLDFVGSFTEWLAELRARWAVAATVS